ncbi:MULTISPECIES: M18 family aminopeptidase [unclassified Streptomyces]|uniref:M18 family aminopeptidase n=1 Tax=unclassified Streptomyces TaxID=2593676 RepID=UPI002DDA892A|nr:MULTISPECIES: M18 family aminopeptidase [unclassified Streptomyces]WSA93555.1 M18 family aminopeptidase [Streptomyces sp. NBC_01795]WSB77925.1 M18 family aminopeptidase [Streptomyces sp. NBC_01775]WSS13819.1 M18 family aminopeptidase [Streptomyces sp. NBC_01186]WSS42643.1 M18 family aminopeptidase [Streptomyces sp. NBC_01187]
MSEAMPFDRGHTDGLMSFLTTSPSPYHGAANAAALLEKAGFRQVLETEAWDAGTGGKYVLRGGALIAWYVPEGATPAAPFRIIGAHTDSPNLRVKPVPDTGAHGWRQIAVEIYGGTLLNTWLDRDLGLSGRLTLRDRSTHLVNVDRPLLRVPQLAIHLDRQANEGLKLDRQRHMTPIWGLGQPREGDLLRFLAEESGLPADEIAGWDLMTHSVEPPSYLGRDRELLAGPRMDNLLSVHAGAAALAAVAESGTAPTCVPVLAAFDHEENGSQSDTGAQGPLLGSVLERSVFARGGSYEDRARAYAGTICLSSDTGHAVHPNYPERHEPGHHPMPDGGPILKVNVNQRYSTDGAGRAVFAAACERAGVPWQTFVSNNDVPCGTTIGPITAARHGITTVDIGVAILSMHAARELCGAKDPFLLANCLTAFLGE